MKLHQWFILAAAAGGVFAVSRADEPPLVASAELKQLSLEELTQVEVTSVSRRSEPLSETAAAVQVITGEQIERAAARNLPDALRLATGIQVSQQDGREWAIAARGLDVVAANKMEVQADGRSLYTPLFSGVFWDVQGLMMDNVDRIEIIRGPGAALWGSDAVNGVINIISKSAADTQGWYSNAAVGTDHRLLEARYGGPAGPDGHYRAYVKATSTQGLVFPSGATVGDDARMVQAGGRLDLAPAADSTLTIQGDAYRGFVGQYATPLSTVQGADAVSRWERITGDGGAVRIRGYYDYTDRNIPATYTEARNTGNVEAERELHTADHAAVVGIRARFSADEIDNGPVIGFEPPRKTIQLYSLYGQDQYTLPADMRWRLVYGTTVEHNSYTGFEIQPTARLAFSPTDHCTVWAGVSRAVRTPTRIDSDYRITSPPFLIYGYPKFKSEELTAYEAGWRWNVGQTLLFDVSGFEDRYDRLRTFEQIGPGLTFREDNLMRGHSRGVELNATVRPVPWARFILGCRYLDQRLSFAPGSNDPFGSSVEGNDARVVATLQSSFDLPHKLQFDIVLRHVGRLPAPEVPAYTEADARLAWMSPRGWELAISGRNLVHAHHREFGADSTVAPQVRRSGEISVTLRK